MLGNVERRSKNKHVQREKDRIKKDEEMTDRLVELERSAVQKAEFESDIQGSSIKALRRMELANQKEAVLGHAALTMVRREALRNLLEEEELQHNQELNVRGLAVYRQRV